jgi:glycosyltransferase involved in cell wall biosynthesis
MMNYAIITPVKNEISYIEKTIDSVINQTILPRQWIIVNDSSNDGTENILSQVESEYDWIKVVTPGPFTISDYSSRVVHLFNFGYENLNFMPEYVAKLDADVQFKIDFYEKIFEAFETNPILGVCSGYLTTQGVPEKIDSKRPICTRGATKVYRVKCLKEIGGIVGYKGWDTLDNVAARAKGWDVSIVNEYFEHLKDEGSKAGSSLRNHYRTGFSNGSIPYSCVFFLTKSFSKLFDKPILLGTLFQVAGYIKGRFFSRVRPFPAYVVKQLHEEQKLTLKTYLRLV